jgi:ketosteroid isomerase-like protein
MHPSEKLIHDFHALQGRIYAGEAEADAVATLLTDDIIWHVPGRSAIAGEYRGRERVLEYFARRRDKAHGSLRIQVRHTLADDEFVMQLAGGSARFDGNPLAWETVGVYRIREGKIAECWLLPFDQHAFDEIWF